MKLTFFGVGYVGLVQGAVFAEVGHDVLCVDRDADKIACLERGELPIFEPGLAHVVQKNRANGRLSFTTDADRGVAHGEVVFIAVGTPPDADGAADVQAVLGVARAVAERMTAPVVVVDKSTVPVGTADRVRAEMDAVLARRGLAGLDFDVVSNPEFLKEGNALDDCLRPERIVIGTARADTAAKMRELYAPFTRNHDCVMLMDVRSAELTKYAANCMLATKISFMNEMAAIAERLGADIEVVRKGIGADRRIGYDFLYPGCGYGGSCFPKDVAALIRTARATGYAPAVLEAVDAVNAAQKRKLFALIDRHFAGDVRGKTFAIWGLAFKPNTDDMREAPSRVLMEALWAAGARVRAYDPEAMREARRLYGDRADLALTADKESALEGASALAVCTDWNDFRAPDFAAVRAKLREPTIFDGRNLYDPARLRALGFTYYGIGRGASLSRAPDARGGRVSE